MEYKIWVPNFIFHVYSDLNITPTNIVPTVFGNNRQGTGQSTHQHRHFIGNAFDLPVSALGESAKTDPRRTVPDRHMLLPPIPARLSLPAINTHNESSATADIAHRHVPKLCFPHLL